MANVPLTERVLAVLPGPRWVWMIVWAAIPLGAIFLPDSYVATVGKEPFAVRALAGVAFCYGTFLTLWGVGKFTRDVATAEESLRDVGEDDHGEHAPVFRGLGSIVGPLALAAVFVVTTTIKTADLAGTDAALAWLPTTIATNVAATTGIWVFLAILLGLDRLGRQKLSLDRFPEDPSLGLSEVGRLAFGWFWVYAAAFALFLLPGRSDAFRLSLSIGLFVLGIGAFFASMLRLHRQLVAERTKHIEWARDLYVRAYEPVRFGSIEALERQAPALAAAEAIEKRAEEIQKWPFSERRMRQMLAIAGTMLTFGSTSIIVNFILSKLDF